MAVGGTEAVVCCCACSKEDFDRTEPSATLVARCPLGHTEAINELSVEYDEEALRHFDEPI